MAFGHFLLGSQNLMVMALGSCVEWPYVGLLSKKNLNIYKYNLNLLLSPVESHAAQYCMREVRPLVLSNFHSNLRTQIRHLVLHLRPIQSASM